MYLQEGIHVHRRMTLAVLAVAASAAIAGSALAGDVASAAGKKAAVVKTARNAELDRTIVVTRRGLSLYTLSAERRGRFICVDASCLSLWRPLVVARGTKPRGAPSLGTVRRPNGKTQVTYRGRPLYTFTEDSEPGDVNGEGFRDVGVWHTAVVRR
jgi:predicted lipoprotein with Yx(FWY)xxD motif